MVRIGLGLSFAGIFSCHGFVSRRLVVRELACEFKGGLDVFPGDVWVVFQQGGDGIAAAKRPEDRGNQDTGATDHGLAVADGLVDLEARIHCCRLAAARSFASHGESVCWLDCHAKRSFAICFEAPVSDA